MRKKKKHHDWLAISVVVLAVAGSFTVGAYLAAKFVAPCVCVFARATGGI